MPPRFFRRRAGSTSFSSTACRPVKTVRRRLSRGARPCRAGLHQATKPGVRILHQRVDRRPRLRTGRFISVRGRLQRRRFHFLNLELPEFQKVGELRILKQHANRADQRRLLRDDVIGGERRDISARRTPSPSTTTTIGFLAFRRVRVLQSFSDPAVVPPGELMWTMTAGAFDFSESPTVPRLSRSLVAADQTIDAAHAGSPRRRRSVCRPQKAWRKRRLRRQRRSRSKPTPRARR